MKKNGTKKNKELGFFDQKMKEMYDFYTKQWEDGLKRLAEKRRLREQERENEKYTDSTPTEVD